MIVEGQVHGGLTEALAIAMGQELEQIATEAHWWFGAIQIAPAKPQIARRSTDQFRNFGIDLGGVPTA